MSEEVLTKSVDAVATGTEGPDEIGELLGFEGDVHTGEEPSSSTTVTEPIVDTPSINESEGTVEGDSPVVEPPPNAESSQPSELDLLKQQNENLLKLIGELSNKPKDEVVSTSITPSGEPKSLETLLEEMDFDEVMESKTKFVSLIKEVATSVREATIKELSGQIPQVIVPHVNQQLSLQELHRQFYTDNPELSGLKGYVSQIAKEYAEANPEKTVVEVLGEVAKIAKTNLGLPLEPISQSTSRGGAPVLPGGTRSTKVPPKQGKTEADEIADLINL